MDRAQELVARIAEEHAHGGIRQLYERSLGNEVFASCVGTECACGWACAGGDQQEVKALWAAHLAEIILVALKTRTVEGRGQIPCDVKLPPATIIEAGCSWDTLRLAMSAEYRPRKFTPTPATPESTTILDDAALLNALRENSWDLRCFDRPTGGGDADIGWRIVGHWQAEPHERTIAEVYADDPRAAILAALSESRGERAC